MEFEPSLFISGWPKCTQSLSLFNELETLVSYVALTAWLFVVYKDSRYIMRIKLIHYFIHNHNQQLSDIEIQ